MFLCMCQLSSSFCFLPSSPVQYLPKSLLNRVLYVNRCSEFRDYVSNWHT
uniref:Uncharacterized protein n=1 Tax=Anguilla anguilla TaxID=7936 RepID=A0A0E9U6X9_ANGAN